MRGSNSIIRWLILLSPWLSQQLYGQADSTNRPSAPWIRYVLPDYDKLITRYGRHQEFFRVQTVQKNGVLIRSDSFIMLPATGADGFPLDSLSRMRQQGPTRIMYEQGHLHVACGYKKDRLDGPFLAYDEAGALKRRDYYRKGRLVHSHCYTPTGKAQPCEAFYQRAKFTGQWSVIEAYMRQRFDSLLAGEQVWRIRARFRINELGQLAHISVEVDGPTTIAPQLPQLRQYVEQTIWGMPAGVVGWLHWQPAVFDGRASGSSCTLLLSRSNGVVVCRLAQE